MDLGLNSRQEGIEAIKEVRRKERRSHWLTLGCGVETRNEGMGAATKCGRFLCDSRISEE